MTTIATKTELNNKPEEFIADDQERNDPFLRLELVSGINGLAQDPLIAPLVSKTSNSISIKPNGLNFQSMISNGNASYFNSVTDFSIYNAYIHHTFAGSTPDSQLIQGLTQPITAVQPLNNIIRASVAFEMYNQAFRYS